MFGLRGRHPGLLVSLGKPAPDPGMAAPGVIPLLDVLEDRLSGLGVSAEAPPAGQLAFERGEKALGHGVVVAVPGKLQSATAIAASSALKASKGV